MIITIKLTTDELNAVHDEFTADAKARRARLASLVPDVCEAVEDLAAQHETLTYSAVEGAFMSGFPFRVEVMPDDA